MADGSIRFFTDLSTAGFESGAKRLQSVSASTAASVKGAFGSATASIAGLVAPLLTVYTAINSVRNALNLTDRLSELSKSTGEAAGNLLVLERAFQNTGIGAEKVGPMFAKMSSFISDLAAGTPKAQQTAEALGVTLEQLKGKTPTQQFQVLLQAVSRIADENLRAASAGDIFGDKMGYKLVPFARDFNAEMANASAELGSTVRLLNENATGIENMGDKFAAISGKLTEFTIGLASGTTGANDLVEALSKIDAAGLGERLGQALRAAFAAPMDTIKAIGYTLETGVKVAGNALINAVVYAGETWTKTFSSTDYLTGLGMKLQAALMEGVNAFNKGLAYGIEEVLLKPLASLPGMVGEPFRAALKTLNEIQATLAENSEINWKNWQRGNELMTKAYTEAQTSSQILSKDWLGVAESAEKAAYHIDQAAQKSSPQITAEAAKTEEHFQKGSTALTNALKAIRGFNLGGGAPLPMPGAIPPPSGGPLAPPGGGGGLPPPSPPPSGGGGGGGRGGGGGAGAGQPLSNQMQSALMRANATQQQANQKASEYIARGMYNSAVTTQQSGQRAFNSIMQNATVRQLSSQFQFSNRPAGNAGEALSSIQSQIGSIKTNELIKQAPGFNPQKGELENFKNALLQGQFSNLPPGGGGGGGGGAGSSGSGAGGAGQGGGAGGPGGPGGPGGGSPPGGPGAPQPNLLQEIVTDIYNLLDERLPIQALV